LAEKKIDPDPMDFSAWFEAYLGGHWHTFDARHSRRRIGRILIGLGRDAGDVPITIVFGKEPMRSLPVRDYWALSELPFCSPWSDAKTL